MKSTIIKDESTTGSRASMSISERDHLSSPSSRLSPRLAALSRNIRQGDIAALETFWREVTEQGTPLIEPLVGSEDESRVTFLWRAEPGVSEVLLFSSLSTGGQAGDQLTRLRGTDLWHKTYAVRNDLRATYRFLVDGVSYPDPHNRQRTFVPGDEVSPFGQDTQLSILRLPCAPALPWMTPVPCRASGQVSQHAFDSELLGHSYRVWIYTPANYTRRTEPYPLLLFLDGWAYNQALLAPTILDNLIDIGALPPLVAVMLAHPNRETRGRELAFSLPFLDFITQELLPWIRQHYQVSTNPAQNVVAGLSLSGVTAALLALRHSDLFGNVLAQSGSFQWKLPGDTEHERLANLVVEEPTAPVRFHLDAGLLETSPTSDGGPSLLVSNRHLRQLLQAKGYPVHYEEFSGGHDYVCWQETLVDGLLALLKGFGTEKG